MSKAPDDHLQATEQEGSVHSSQQAGQQHVNTADQFSKTELTEGSKIEQPVQVEQQSSHLQQAYPEIQLQQAETDSFQLAEKETGYFGQQSFAGAKVDVAQPSVVQQNVKQTVGQQASSGTQDTRKGPSIPFNMLIPILQAHLDRDKDMQLQTVWAKLRRNEVNKDDFLRVIRNIVGDQMLKQAAHKVFVQMQAQMQRNSQANSSQQCLFSQLSAQQMASSGSAQLHDQKIRPPGPPNQGQKNQVSSSPQAFAPPSGTQPQNSVHYLAHDNPNQNPDAKGTNVVPNQPSRMNTSVPLQTKDKQHQPTQLQQASQQIYGANNPGAQAYPRSITGSLRSPSPVPETQPSMHAPGMAPAKMVPPPTHPMMQHNATAWQMHQNRELKTNAPPPNANMKQNSESVGKVRMAGTGNSSAKGKQGTPNSTPNASGATKSSKKSGGQKKSLEAAGSMQPSSKKQKTSGGSQEQSIDELNDVTAASGVNIRDNKEIDICREMLDKMGYPKLELGLSAMPKDQLADSLAYNSLKGLILSKALMAQKDAEDESTRIAFENLRSEVISLRNEALEKDKILLSLVERLKSSDARLASLSEVEQKMEKFEKKKEADAKRIADLEYALSIQARLQRFEVEGLEKKLDEITENFNVEQIEREISDTKRLRVQKNV